MIKRHKVCDKCGALGNINSFDSASTFFSIEFVEDYKKRHVDICGECFISMFKKYSQIKNKSYIPEPKSVYEGIRFKKKR